MEYYDPSNLFPLIARGLNARLPLRNLHWNSPSRPLRSINFLHVDLVPSYESQNSTISPPSSSSGPGQAIADSNDSRPERINEGLSKSRPGLPRQKTIDSVDHSSLGPVKERRHQIPGLRQTPYLKVYLLRCDDGETYKTSSRKHLREWIKAHTLPAQSTSSVNAQENHDAFEWLIVHVVLPNTPAATQPRSSTGGASSNRTEKVTGGSRFLGKSSSTIFEKISADFNGSSKSAKDRVAQIRLHQSDLPNTAPSQMPAAPTPSYSLDQQDQKNAWDDMISKMKSLILTSFDLRVAQYEEDIRERDSQRNLPGWNFCTFFVLKEGLARGFESVGLVEDALVGYDELALGLEIIVREQASGPVGEQHGATFLDHNEDLLQEARIALSATNAQDSKGEENPSAQPRVSTERAVEQDPERWPLNANRKQYRELILANNISMFDFHSYIFSRQLSLLLRLGNGLSPDAGSTERPRSEPTFAQSMHQIQSDMQSTPLKHRADEPENLFALAEVCRRAMEFITSIARIMRSDLLHALQQDQKEAINEIEGRNIYPGDHNVIVENMVSSWTYAMSQQILEQTATVSMKPLSSSVLDTKPFMTKSAQPSSLDQAMRDRSVRAARMPHPARTSSLPTSLSVADLPPTTGSSISDASSEYADKDPSTSMQSRLMQAGTEELAAYRAELYLLARRILSSLGEKRGWNVEFTDFAVSSSVNGTNLEDVPLDESSLQVLQSSRPSLSPLTIAGVKCTPLSSALRSEDTFYTLYEVRLYR